MVLSLSSGTKTEEDSRRACTKYAAILKKAGKVNVDMSNYKVRKKRNWCRRHLVADRRLPLVATTVLCAVCFCRSRT